MAKAYLVARLNTSVMPPFVETVRITSQPATSMADGMWVEIFSMEGVSFSAATHSIQNVLDTGRKNLGFAVEMMTTEDRVIVGERSKAVSAALQLLDVFQKNGFKLPERSDPNAATIRMLLHDYEVTTNNMLGEYTRAKQGLKDDSGGELKDGLLRMAKITLLQRIDFLLQYKHVYSSGQNWKDIEQFLLKE